MRVRIFSFSKNNLRKGELSTVFLLVVYLDTRESGVFCSFRNQTDNCSLEASKNNLHHILIIIIYQFSIRS
jgi:hypothetical protein